MLAVALAGGRGCCKQRSHSTREYAPRRHAPPRANALVALVFLLALPSVARPQEVSTSELRQVDPYKISVSVSSVVLHATVENHKGAPVSGLGKDDFQVYEDGALQQIEYL